MQNNSGDGESRLMNIGILHVTVGNLFDDLLNPIMWTTRRQHAHLVVFPFEHPILIKYKKILGYLIRMPISSPIKFIRDLALPYFPNALINSKQVI